jgi:hypothetical protein
MPVSGKPEIIANDFHRQVNRKKPHGMKEKLVCPLFLDLPIREERGERRGTERQTSAHFSKYNCLGVYGVCPPWMMKDFTPATKKRRSGRTGALFSRKRSFAQKKPRSRRGFFHPEGGLS